MTASRQDGRPGSTLTEVLVYESMGSVGMSGTPPRYQQWSVLEREQVQAVELRPKQTLTHTHKRERMIKKRTCSTFHGTAVSMI